jgi:arylsulfatase
MRTVASESEPLKNHDQSAPDETRREFLKTAGAGVLATALGAHLPGKPARAAAPSAGPEPREAAAGPYNILFILTDQERYFRAGELPWDYRLPAHERLAKNGVVFENHRINSCV